MKTAITTVDNPYDPIDQFDSWFLYDVTMNHNTCALLGRIARTSDQLSDAENDAEIERAIDFSSSLPYQTRKSNEFPYLHTTQCVLK